MLCLAHEMYLAFKGLTWAAGMGSHFKLGLGSLILIPKAFLTLTQPALLASDHLWNGEVKSTSFGVNS